MLDKVFSTVHRIMHTKNSTHFYPPTFRLSRTISFENALELLLWVGLNDAGRKKICIISYKVTLSRTTLSHSHCLSARVASKHSLSSLVGNMLLYFVLWEFFIKRINYSSVQNFQRIEKYVMCDSVLGALFYSNSKVFTFQVDFICEQPTIPTRIVKWNCFYSNLT